MSKKKLKAKIKKLKKRNKRLEASLKTWTDNSPLHNGTL